jgi:hypothetical protein
MSENITLTDLRKAMDLIEREPEELIYEDDFQKIWGRGLGPTRIQLTKKGAEEIKELLEENEWR